MSISKSVKNRLNHYGKWALVTGASSGIGKEIAFGLADSGINLVIVGRRKQHLDRVSTVIQDTYQVEVRTIIADLAVSSNLEQIIDETNNIDIGILIACAGYATSGAFAASSLKEELNMMAVNCTALFVLTHHFTQRFKEKGVGAIVLISSILGFQGVPYAAHYAATKAYVQTLAEAIAIELKGTGVDILVAAPEPVNSGFSARADMKMGKAQNPRDIAIPVLKALGRKQVVYPGVLTKVLIASLSMLPRRGKVRVMKMIMSGFTKHQRT